jgi:hypothetical protein
MPVLLFSLRNVPEDEAEEIRELLTSKEIEYYETPAGKWGISAPAVWLRDENELRQAKALIDTYQKARFVKQRQAYESLKRAGKHKTVLDAIKENPFQFVVYTSIAVIVLYFSIRPFFNLGS